MESTKKISLVFTPYFREMKDPSIPGTGLGLYSAKKFIELMKGTLEVTSTNGITSFIISLPQFNKPTQDSPRPSERSLQAP